MDNPDPVKIFENRWESINPDLFDLPDIKLPHIPEEPTELTFIGNNSVHSIITSLKDCMLQIVQSLTKMHKELAARPTHKEVLGTDLLKKLTGYDHSDSENDSDNDEDDKNQVNNQQNIDNKHKREMINSKNISHIRELRSNKNNNYATDSNQKYKNSKNKSYKSPLIPEHVAEDLVDSVRIGLRQQSESQIKDLKKRLNNIIDRLKRQDAIITKHINNLNKKAEHASMISKDSQNFIRQWLCNRFTITKKQKILSNWNIVIRRLKKEDDFKYSFFRRIIKLYEQN